MELARGGRPAGRQSGAVYAVTATQTGNLSLDLPLSVCVHITAGRSVTPLRPQSLAIYTCTCALQPLLYMYTARYRVDFTGPHVISAEYYRDIWKTEIKRSLITFIITFSGIS